jgi:mannose-6-phosphate isomerase-like protein (cupin superfamily)
MKKRESPRKKKPRKKNWKKRKREKRSSRKRSAAVDVVNRDSIEKFTTKDGSAIREILAPANSSLRAQSLAEATLRPGQSTEKHLHVKTEEVYYVLSGSGLMEMGEEKRKVGPGDGIAIPPGSEHRLKNTGGENLVFLCCCSPAYSHDDTVMS